MSIVAKYPNNTESDPLALKQANNLSDLNNVATAKSNLSLNNVDNTSDIDKPVSSATQSALNDKVNIPSASEWTEFSNTLAS